MGTKKKGRLAKGDLKSIMNTLYTINEAYFV